MKILHINIGGPFNYDMSYQGAVLPIENYKAGHEVTVISSCLKWENNKIVVVPEEDVYRDGIRYIRLRYDKIINPIFTEKVRKINKMLDFLNEIRPDVILNHDIQMYELITVSKYKERNPHIKLYADSHSDKNNSAQTWMSRIFLHKLFYKTIIHKCLKNIDKILCVSTETIDFLKDMYNISEDCLEYYPLGGHIISENDKENLRKEIRTELGINNDDIVMCHSGKMDRKKKTKELIENFMRVGNSKFKLLIIGVFDDSLNNELTDMINKDNRIHYLGWKSSTDLIKIIAAADLYVQPGSQSATMQNALCSGTPVLFQKNKSHEVFMRGNAFAIEEDDDMERIFNDISNAPEMLHEMSRKAYIIARDLLDYEKLAKRITN